MASHRIEHEQLCYDIAIMQSLPNNPFPMSDKPDKVEPVTPPPTPMPNPVASQPNPAQALFVQPAAQPHATITPKGPLAKLETSLISLFNYPQIQLPDYIKDMIARYLPWLTLMVCFILAPLVLIGIAMGGFLGFITSFYVINTNVFYWLTITLLTVQLVLMIIAIPKLLAEKRQGWHLLFTASFIGIITVITNIFAQFVSPVTALLTGLFVFALVLYILFQTRSYYTN